MKRLVAFYLIFQVYGLFLPIAAFALPPPEDLPEEVLRTEVITEARSPIDGEPLTASEYAELEEALQQQPELYGVVPQNLRSLLFLLRIRRAIRIFIPFLP
jgi:hypothetical protein